MMETNLSNGMNDRSYSRFFGFVIVMSAVLFSFSSCLEGKKEEGVKTAEALIFPADAKASSEYNTGDVYVSLLKESGNTMIAHFIFKPYSRNFWHYHPDAEQTLLVLDGEGYYQEEGGEKRVIPQMYFFSYVFVFRAMKLVYLSVFLVHVRMSEHGIFATNRLFIKRS